MTYRTIVIAVFMPLWCYCQQVMPSWGAERTRKVSEKYVVTHYLQPYFLQHDFSGDGVNDLAILIEQRVDRKKGILILFGESEKSFIVGAGEFLGSAGDNFDWAGNWNVCNDLETYETTFDRSGDVEGSKPITLMRSSIRIRQNEGSGGLIYFNGKSFVWIHQGD